MPSLAAIRTCASATGSGEPACRQQPPESRWVPSRRRVLSVVWMPPAYASGRYAGTRHDAAARIIGGAPTDTAVRVTLDGMTDQPLDDFVRQVALARREHRLPAQARRVSEDFTNETLALLFPHFAAPGSDGAPSVEEELSRLCGELHGFLLALGTTADEANRVSSAFTASLPALLLALEDDAQATLEADPAAQSVDEVLLAYPGFFAVACHRIAHRLHELEVELLPRLITEYAHRETGIDIHPAAQLGHSVAIDHGTGIVVGETAVIGNRVRLYQGVTLGALSVRKDIAQQKRHPTIEDDVVIYANATILGGEAIIGSGSVIGGNVWLTHAVPPGSIVTHAATVERPREPGESLLEYYI